MVYGQLHLQSMGQCVKVSVLRVIYEPPGVCGVKCKKHDVMAVGKCAAAPH